MVSLSFCLVWSPSFSESFVLEFFGICGSSAVWSVLGVGKRSSGLAVFLKRSSESVKWTRFFDGLITKVTCLSVLLGYLSFFGCLQEVRVLFASEDWAFLSIGIPGVVPVVQFYKRIDPRNWDGVAAQSFGGTSKFFLMDLLNHISGVCCHVCAYVLLRHFLLLRIRVEQRKQFGSVSAFLCWTEEVVVFWCWGVEFEFLVLVDLEEIILLCWLV